MRASTTGPMATRHKGRCIVAGTVAALAAALLLTGVVSVAAAAQVAPVVGADPSLGAPPPPAAATAGTTSAAACGWVLQLRGPASPKDLTYRQFAALAKYRTTWNDGTHTWAGVPLWRLVGMVDDKDSSDVQFDLGKEGLRGPGRRSVRRRHAAEHRRPVGKEERPDRRSGRWRAAAVRHPRRLDMDPRLARAARRSRPGRRPGPRRRGPHRRLQAGVDATGQPLDRARLGRAGARRPRDRRRHRRPVSRTRQGSPCAVDRHRHLDHLHRDGSVAPGRPGRWRQRGHAEPRPARPRLPRPARRRVRRRRGGHGGVGRRDGDLHGLAIRRLERHGLERRRPGRPPGLAPRPAHAPCGHGDPVGLDLLLGADLAASPLRRES